MASPHVEETIDVNPKSNLPDECPAEPSSLSNNDDPTNGSMGYLEEHPKEPTNGAKYDGKASEQTDLTREYLEEFACSCLIRSHRSAVSPKVGSHRCRALQSSRYAGTRRLE
jgi:hypothetical protein